MVDMRAMGKIPQLDAGDPRAVIAGLRDQAAGAAAAREELADMVGESESDDRTVRATVGSDGLEGLVLEAKAMRLPSVELAETIVTTVRAAADELARARRERAEELGVTGGGIDLEQSRERLAAMQATMESGTADMKAVYEKMRGQLGV